MKLEFHHINFVAEDVALVDEPDAALDAVRTGMAKAGFDVPDKQVFSGETATFFKDPEGMRVEVTVYE